MSNSGPSWTQSDDDERKAGTNVQAQWDKLKSTHTQENIPHDINPASKAILDALRTRRFQDTAGWLNSLVGQAPVSAVAERYQESDPETRCMYEWADNLFDKFERFTARFNATAAGTNLIVTCQRPEYKQKKSTTFGVNNDLGFVFDGHLATLHWAMAIRGGKGKVQFFILPSDRLLGFTNGTYGENDYQPFMELAVAFENNQLNWSLGGKAITIDAIDPLAKELFGDLIRVASGTMSDSELFAHPTTELKLGETLAVGYQAPAVVPEDSTSLPAQQGAATTSAEKVSAACTNFMQAIAEALITAGHEKENAEVVSDSTAIARLDKTLAGLASLKTQVGDAIGQYNDSIK